MARKNPYLGRVIYRALYRAIQTLDGADTDAVTALTDLVARDAAYLTDEQMAALALSIEAKVPVDEGIEQAAKDAVAEDSAETATETTETGE